MKKAHERLRKVRVSVTQYDALLEVEDLICNYQKPINRDWKVTDLFLEGKFDLEEFARSVTRQYYKDRNTTEQESAHMS